MKQRSWVCWACYYDDFGENVSPYSVGYFDPRSLDERCSRCGAGPTLQDQMKLRLLELRDAAEELLRDPGDTPEGMLTLATFDGGDDAASSSASSGATTDRILAEMKQIREGVEDIRSSGPKMEPGQIAVSVAAAMKLLGCGKNRVFELLKNGALQRVPNKVGRETMILKSSIDALLHSPEPREAQSAPKAKRSGQAARDAILQMVRSPRQTQPRRKVDRRGEPS